jgi:endonuclease-3 related protein
MVTRRRQTLRDMFEVLLATYGPQGWWPGETATEVAIGAVLTQNTAWTNVERALGTLKRAGLVDFQRLHAARRESVAGAIRSAGTFRVKARRLKALADWVCARGNGRIEEALGGSLTEKRRELLGIHGIGPETADAILLYAGNQATFVVDAYTRRVLRRHGFICPDANYESVRALFHSSLAADIDVYQEFHALLVQLGKRHCRARARCDGCPLADWPHDSSA